MPVVTDGLGNLAATIRGDKASGRVAIEPFVQDRMNGRWSFSPRAGTLGTECDSDDFLKSIVWKCLPEDPTGLIWLGTRYYDPQFGRFISPDPLGHEGSWDLYSYANGDPVNYWDPTGAFASKAYETTAATVQAGAQCVMDNPMEFASMAADSIPGISTAKTIFEAAAGVDPITWEETSRLAAFASIGVSFIPGAKVGAKLGVKMAAKEVKVAQKIHKNSRAYQGETHVYRIFQRSEDGSKITYKIGESARGVRKSDGLSIRAEEQVRKLGKQNPDSKFSSKVKTVFPDKNSARNYETDMIEGVRKYFGESKLPGNKGNR